MAPPAPVGLGLRMDAARSTRTGRLQRIRSYNSPQALLVFFGIPAAELYGHNRTRRTGHRRLWTRDHWELVELFERAQNDYREKIKAHHPDRGGDTATAAIITTAWRRLSFMFGRRGVGPVRFHWSGRRRS